MIENWRRHGAISQRAKIVGVFSMVAILVLSLAMNASSTVLIIQAIVLTSSAAFVLTRPAPPK